MPIATRTLLVIRIECLLVIEPFVTKAFPKTLQPVAAAHQSIPVVVAAFVAKMPEQGAVALVHHFTHLFTGAVLRLAEIDGDHAGAVPGQHLVGFVDLVAELIPAQFVFHEFEGEATNGILIAAYDGQAQFTQGIQQATLGQLDAMPELDILLVAEIGNDVIETAGSTVGMRVPLRHQPVTNIIVAVIGALPVAAPVQAGPPQAVRFGLQGADLQFLADKTEHAAAGHALAVLEIQGVAASAGKGLHRECPSMEKQPGGGQDWSMGSVYHSPSHPRLNPAAASCPARPETQRRSVSAGAPVCGGPGAPPGARTGHWPRRYPQRPAN